MMTVIAHFFTLGVLILNLGNGIYHFQASHPYRAALSFAMAFWMAVIFVEQQKENL